MLDDASDKTKATVGKQRCPNERRKKNMSNLDMIPLICEFPRPMRRVGIECSEELVIETVRYYLSRRG
jgi:hypothetical protein